MTALQSAERRRSDKVSVPERTGIGSAIRYGFGDSSLGIVLVAATAAGICAVQLGESREALQRELAGRFPDAALKQANDDMQASIKRVIDAIEQPDAQTELLLDIQGTAFQQQVWAALGAIPPGSTASYADIAARINQPGAARAVAKACAANPVAVVVPCHRVVRADGALSGYRWGVARKAELLRREGAR